MIEPVRENQILLNDSVVVLSQPFVVLSQPFWLNFLKHMYPEFINSRTGIMAFLSPAIDDYVAQVLYYDYGARYLSHNALYGILDFPDVESKIAFILEWS